MVHQGRVAVPAVTQRAKIVGRGVGYGAVAGVVIGALVWLIICLYGVLFGVPAEGDWDGGWKTIGEIGYALVAVIGYTLVAATVGAVVGTAVGLVAGTVFALSAPCLARRPVLAVVAGVAVPGAAFELLAGSLHLPSPLTTLVVWLLVAPAGGLAARPVLFGRRPSTTDPIE
jgi:hypothetical protein